MTEEEHTIKFACGVCGEKLEAENCQETILVVLNHMKQSHKVAFDELVAKIAEAFEIKK